MSSREQMRPSPARDLWALGWLHAAGLAAGIAVLGAQLGLAPAGRWAGGTATILALQWLYLARRLALNHRPGEARLLTGFGPATWITLLRGLLLAGTAGFMVLPRLEGTWAWAPMALFTTAISLDLLDGFAARRTGRVTRLGEALELGMDSLAMLVGSALAVLNRTLPWWYLSFGLASPVFRLGLWLRARLDLPVGELPPSAGRRRLAGFSMGFLSAALWPIVSPVAAAWTGTVFLIPFLVGFGRDWAAVSGGLDPDPAGDLPLGQPAAPGLTARISRRVRARHALWLAGPALVWLVLRDIPAQALLAALGGLAWWELLALGLVNLAVVTSFSGRWWSVLGSLGRVVPYFQLAGYRLAAFAISYFTPGPHLGGEPLQVFLLHRREAVPVGPAAASVVLEKAIELLVNSSILAVCVLAIARLGMVPGSAAGWLAAAAVALLMFPLAALVAFWAGARPVTWITRWLPADGERWRSLAAAAVEAEGEIIAFCRRGPAGVLRALGFSLVSWGFLLWEYWLALRFLGLPVGALETLAVVGAARLANLLPFPGGLGVLEASQVIALSSLGYTPAQGAALALLIRARDVAFGGAGLLLGLGLVRRTGRAGADGPGAHAEGKYSPRKSN
jgi:uncharacterized protein (TIRG00374 family)